MRMGYIPPFRGHGLRGFVNGCISVTLGLKIMNSNHVAKHKVTQLIRTQLHANFSEMVPPVHPMNFTRISVPRHAAHTTPTVTSEEGHENAAPDGSTRLQKKTELCGDHHWANAKQNISNLAPCSKTESLTTYTDETSHTTENPTRQIAKQHQS